MGTTASAGANLTGACNTTGDLALLQVSTDPGYDYVVPAGGGEINSWSFATAAAPAGTPYELLVARGVSVGIQQVVGSDSEIVPMPVPTITTFALANPIAVQAGISSACGWCLRQPSHVYSAPAR